MDKNEITPVLRAEPVVERLDLPARADLLPKIESGEISHLDFTARVYRMGPNRNSVQFRGQDMAAFAASFEGQPYLRNHQAWDVGARDGTIIESAMMGSDMVQKIRLTTRRGMTDFVEGRMDRFSIGWWDYTDITCNICGTSWLARDCSHWPGRSYETQAGKLKCEITFVEPKGMETSAVNAPAVPGTGIEAALHAKLDIFGDEMSADEKQRILSADEGLEPDASEENPETQGRFLDVLLLTLSKIRPHFVLIGEDFMNIRELLSQRTGLLEQAQAIYTLADEEKRDLTETERASFTEFLEKADALEAQIKTIQAERERLETAKKALSGLVVEPEKPTKGVDPKLMKRGEFNALDARSQALFVSGGGRIED